MRLNRRKIASVAAFSTLGIVVVFVLYLVLLCRPGLFFPHAFTRGGMTLFSDEPIPPEPAGRILADVERRLARSPLAGPRRIKMLRIYICNRRWRFVLFANTRYKVGGLTYPPLSDNIFLRRVHFDANRLVGHSGRETPGERTLSYFVAHEIMHTLLARELGIVHYWRLPAWKNEGYADLVAKGGDFDYEALASKCVGVIGSWTRRDPASICAITSWLPICSITGGSASTSCSIATSTPAQLEAEILASHGGDAS